MDQIEFDKPATLPRRQFIRVSFFTTAAFAIANSPLIGPLMKTAQAATPDLVHDTFNGLLAFIVPGPDAYSQAQEATSRTLGGVDANVAEVLIETLDLSVPFLPQFSAIVASILNNLAQLVNPTTTGPFGAPFANLKYAEKVAVLRSMDATELSEVPGRSSACFRCLCLLLRRGHVRSGDENSQRRACGLDDFQLQRRGRRPG